MMVRTDGKKYRAIIEYEPMFGMEIPMKEHMKLFPATDEIRCEYERVLLSTDAKYYESFVVKKIERIENDGK